MPRSAPPDGPDIEDDEFEATQRLGAIKDALDVLDPAGVGYNGLDLRAQFLGERGKALAAPRRDGHAQALGGEATRQGGAEPALGSDAEHDRGTLGVLARADRHQRTRSKTRMKLLAGSSNVRASLIPKGAAAVSRSRTSFKPHSATPAARISWSKVALEGVV